MKKLILKYLPIPLAIIIAFAGCFTLSSYNKNRSEFAVVSFFSKEIAFDITVSESGRVVKVMPANVETEEKAKDFDIKGKGIADAIEELSKTAQKDETIFVSVYVNEDDDVEEKILKELLDLACSKVSVSCLAAYGKYENYDLQRAIAYKQTIGKVAFVRNYTAVFFEQMKIYLDTLYMYDLEPYDLAFFAEYIFKDSEIKNYAELLSFDLSKYKIERNFMTKEEAEAPLMKYLNDIFGDSAESISYTGYKIERGFLAHSFAFRMNGENRTALVNVYDGSVSEFFLDDY